MAGKTDYLEEAILNTGWRGAAWAYAGPWYVGLADDTTTPDDTGDTGFTEVETPGVNGYNRQPLSSSVASASNNGVITNDLAAISFGPSVSGWGTVKYAGFFSASTGGTLLAWVQLVTPVAVGASQLFQFALSQLSWTED